METESKVTKALRKSPINYFSDLFVAVMVIAWIMVIIIMVVMSIYSTVRLCDTTMWCYTEELVGIPLTGGGVAWMLKNAGQHWIANRNGERAHEDFPGEDNPEVESEEAG